VQPVGRVVIGDDLAAALPELQAQAESRMLDTCTIVRPGDVTTDPLTGQVDPTDTPVYSGRCELRATTALIARDEESATSQVTAQTFTLKVPVGAPALMPGDLARFSATTYTPRLRNVAASVDGVHVGTFTTAQRVPVTILPGVK
jgi:hypothetical protein